MAAKKKAKADTGTATIDVVRLEQREITVCVLGESPLIINRISEKAARQLLMPPPRKTAADKLANLKHVPLDEFRAAPYTLADPKQPTLLAMPIGAFKKAIASAAIDVPGAFKAQIGRLTWIEGVENALVPIFGIPKVRMDPTRSADMNRTPDIRTRVHVWPWAAILRINYVSPNLTDTAILNLLAAAGLIIGIGDWRQEKGSASFGKFRLVDADNPDFMLALRNGGREVQEAAMANPEPAGSETENLLRWFNMELERRRDRSSTKKTAPVAAAEEGEEETDE